MAQGNSSKTAIQVRRWAILLALYGVIVLVYLQVSGWFGIETDEEGYPRGGMTIFYMFGVSLWVSMFLAFLMTVTLLIVWAILRRNHRGGGDSSL